MCGACRPSLPVPFATSATFHTSANWVNFGSFMLEPPHSNGA